MIGKGNRRTGKLIYLKDAEEAGYYIDWNSGSLNVKLSDPQGSGIKIGLFTVDRNKLI